MRRSLYFPIIIDLIKRPPNPLVFINYLSYKLAHLRKKVVLNHFPISLVFFINKKCNLTCEFCFTSADLNNSDANNFNLTYDELITFLNSKSGRRTLRVGLLGGEPFLHPDVFNFLNELYKRRKISTVVTNCTLLKGEKLDLLCKTPISAIGLSLYEDNSMDVKRVAEQLVINKKNFWMQKIIASNEISKIESIIAFAISIGCKNLQLSNYYPMSEEDKALTVYDDNEEYKKASKVLSLKYKGKININWFCAIKRTLAPKKCRIPFNFQYLDNKGSLGACCFLSPNEEKYGNFNTPNSWNAPYYQELRKNLLDENAEPFDVCKNCETLHQDLYGV